MGRDIESLGRQLDIFFDGLIERMDPAQAALLRRLEDENVARWRDESPIAIGDIAPDFTLPDQTGKPITLSKQLAKGPVVLSFYRGGWCPFCSLSLRALDRMRDALAQYDATILTLSPEVPDEAAATARRNFVHFPVLSDAGNAVARRYGLVWKVQAERRALLARLGHDLARINGTTDWALPIGAGYVIAPDGRVVYAHLDPRINRRMEPGTALAVVQELATQPAE